MAGAVLENVFKTFGETVAVENLSLSVDHGEFLVLLGPTGAGKTTTLRLLAGLELPDSGKVLVADADVTALPPAARDVAFVFQQYSLYPHYTVFENLAFPLRAPGRRLDAESIRKRVGEIAEMLRIGHKLNDKVTQLSGGEMQRVSIGRALVRKPNLFLMDEPLSSLDAKLREDLRVELKRIQRDLDATIVYVTHDQLEAMTLADRIGILQEGRLVQIDTPRVAYERPATVYAAQRLGSPQINIVDTGKLGLEDGPPNAATTGIRPEDITVDADQGEEAEIVAVEHRGDETIALIEVDGIRLHALLDAGISMEAGQRTRIAIRSEYAIWFDSQSRLIGSGATG
ncbi:MAG: ABC transporter ATP-binding protein [Albidovulum sp.]|nr:ABC transporter ATP-binding protein [Albidovulum sp.]